MASWARCLTLTPALLLILSAITVPAQIRCSCKHNNDEKSPEVLQLLQRTGHAFKKVGDILLDKSQRQQQQQQESPSAGRPVQRNPSANGAFSHMPYPAPQPHPMMYYPMYHHAYPTYHQIHPVPMQQTIMHPAVVQSSPPEMSPAYLGRKFVSLANEYEEVAEKNTNNGNVEVNMRRGKSPLVDKPSDIVVEVTLGSQNDDSSEECESKEAQEKSVTKVTEKKEKSEKAEGSKKSEDSKKSVAVKKKQEDVPAIAEKSKGKKTAESTKEATFIKTVKIMDVSSEENESGSEEASSTSPEKVKDKPVEVEKKETHTVQVVEAIKMKPETSPLQVESFDNVASTVEKTIEDTVPIKSETQETKATKNNSGERVLTVKTYEETESVESNSTTTAPAHKKRVEKTKAVVKEDEAKKSAKKAEEDISEEKKVTKPSESEETSEYEDESYEYDDSESEGYIKVKPAWQHAQSEDLDEQVDAVADKFGSTSASVTEQTATAVVTDDSLDHDLQEVSQFYNHGSASDEKCEYSNEENAVDDSPKLVQIVRDERVPVEAVYKPASYGVLYHKQEHIIEPASETHDTISSQQHSSHHHHETTTDAALTNEEYQQYITQGSQPNEENSCSGQEQFSSDVQETHVHQTCDQSQNHPQEQAPNTPTETQDGEYMPYHPAYPDQEQLNYQEEVKDTVPSYPAYRMPSLPQQTSQEQSYGSSPQDVVREFSPKVASANEQYYTAPQQYPHAEMTSQEQMNYFPEQPSASAQEEQYYLAEAPIQSGSSYDVVYESANDNHPKSSYDGDAEYPAQTDLVSPKDDVYLPSHQPQPSPTPGNEMKKEHYSTSGYHSHVAHASPATQQVYMVSPHPQRAPSGQVVYASPLPLPTYLNKGQYAEIGEYRPAPKWSSQHTTKQEKAPIQYFKQSPIPVQPVPRFSKHMTLAKPMNQEPEKYLSLGPINDRFNPPLLRSRYSYNSRPVGNALDSPHTPQPHPRYTFQTEPLGRAAALKEKDSLKSPSVGNALDSPHSPQPHPRHTFRTEPLEQADALEEKESLKSPSVGNALDSQHIPQPHPRYTFQTEPLEQADALEEKESLKSPSVGNALDSPHGPQKHPRYTFQTEPLEQASVMEEKKSLRPPSESPSASGAMSGQHWAYPSWAEATHGLQHPVPSQRRTHYQMPLLLAPKISLSKSLPYDAEQYQLETSDLTQNSKQLSADYKDALPLTQGSQLPVLSQRRTNYQMPLLLASMTSLSKPLPDDAEQYQMLGTSDVTHNTKELSGAEKDGLPVQGVVIGEGPQASKSENLPDLVDYDVPQRYAAQVALPVHIIHEKTAPPKNPYAARARRLLASFQQVPASDSGQANNGEARIGKQHSS